MNSNIAYLIGVTQSDGYIYTFHDKSGKFRNRFRLSVGQKSLSMILKVRDILQIEFGRKIKITESNNSKSFRKVYSLSMEFNKLFEKFQHFGIQKERIPEWIKNDEKLFFSYLAGLIDGDGSVNINRPAYPQCRVRITDNKSNEELLILLERFLLCKPWKEKIHNKNAVSHCFCMSHKNFFLIKKNLLPLIQIGYKKQKLSNFIDMKYRN